MRSEKSILECLAPHREELAKAINDRLAHGVKMTAWISDLTAKLDVAIMKLEHNSKMKILEQSQLAIIDKIIKENEVFK